MRILGGLAVCVLIGLLYGQSIESAFEANLVNCDIILAQISGRWPSGMEGRLASLAQRGRDNLHVQLTYLRYLTTRGRLRAALDYLEDAGLEARQLAFVPGPPHDPVHSHGPSCYPYSATDLDIRVGLCEPSLSLGLRARRLAQSQAWDEALVAYREFLVRSPGNLSDDILPEYHLALANFYAGQTGLDAHWRAAMHYWRAGHLTEAQQVLAVMNSDSPRLQAYRQLINAEVMLASSRATEAISMLAAIKPKARDARLRAQIAMLRANDSAAAASDDAERLREYVPTLHLDQSVAGVGRLIGVELLEPDLIDDGGLVNMALFWRDLVSMQESDDSIWLYLGDGAAVQFIATRNLVPDPGFEWRAVHDADFLSNAQATPGYWVQGFGFPQPPIAWRFVKETRGDQLTTVSCLDNALVADERKLAGLQTWFFSTVPNTWYLQIGWISSQRNPSNGLLGVYWDSGDVSVVASRPQHEDWHPYAGLLRSPDAARSATIMAQNTGVPGMVCFDDIVLVRLFGD